MASLLVAFYPIFPATVQDSRSHLQAFRHFWVLATEPRCLVARDMGTGQLISTPVMIRLKPQTTAVPVTASTPMTKARTSKPPARGSAAVTAAGVEDRVLRRQTPCLLPPFEVIAGLRTDVGAQGYWDLELDFQRNPELIGLFRKSQSLHLRRRPAQEGAFAATLQALGTNPMPGSTPAGTAAANQTGDDTTPEDPAEWFFGLPSLKHLTHAERALDEDPLHDVSNGSGGMSSSMDARVALENSMDGSSRDDLLGLRLLFAWADKRATRWTDSDNKGKDELDDGVGEATEEFNWWIKGQYY